MYPQKKCTVCGRKQPIAFMGYLEGKHAFCSEHYNEAVAEHGPHVTLEKVTKDNKEIKRYRNKYRHYCRTIVKYEKVHGKKLLVKMVEKHKELLENKNLDPKQVSLVENDSIISGLKDAYLPTLIPYTMNDKELSKVVVGKSYNEKYYEKLTGRKVKERGSNPWLF